MRLAVLAGLVAGAAAAPAADQVTNLPGYGKPLTATYSGYLDAGNGKHLHYLFYASQTGKSTDPVVFWYNGGPGCSSLEGAFQESGPLWTLAGGNSLQVNEYSWNKFAHQVFIEAPACVGFSYADTEAGCSHNDTGTAADNLKSIIDWYSKFPEYQHNDMFITGESYAGIYIPTLAFDIYQYNLAGTGPIRIPLKGILVGNGCIGNAAGVCGSSPYGDYLSLAQFHGHGFISDKAFNKAVELCGDWSTESPACQDAVQAASNEAGDNFDVYDLYSGMYGVCNYGDFQRMRKSLRAPVRKGGVIDRALARMEAKWAAAFAANATLKNSCTSDNDISVYLNRADVQAALHVQAPAGGWQECANIDYTPNIADEREVIYPTLVQKAGLQIVIYNGEADACVPVTDNQWWTSSMNYTVAKPWTQWTASDGTLGGYVTKYKPTGAKSNFTFITVRGAGHMVPQMQPQYAYDLANTYIHYGEL